LCPWTHLKPALQTAVFHVDLAHHDPASPMAQNVDLPKPPEQTWSLREVIQEIS